MNLKDFVAESLVEIFQGVADAKQRLKDGGGEVNAWPMGSAPDFIKAGGFMAADGRKIGVFVDFDVAVTATEGTATSGKIGVLSGLINLASGGASHQSNESLSRIKFRVPVALP